MTGIYECDGDLGLTHSLEFTTTELGVLRIKQSHVNLDAGDCSPRGEQVGTLAEQLGCTVGQLVGRDLGKFGFICQGNQNVISNIIAELSREILRPTLPGGL